MNVTDLMMAYEYGIDYGLLLAEHERDSEDFFDATGCAIYSAKMCMPSIPPRRRQAHSAAWRTAKRASMDRFLELVVRAANSDKEAAHE